MERNTDDHSARAQIIDNEADWDQLAPEWSALFDASPRASTPLKFGWLRHWWRLYGGAYGQRGRGLRIIAARRGPRLIGVLPLYACASGGAGMGVRRLRFLSTGEAEHEETCPDYMDLLYAPGEEEACLRAVWKALGAMSWDCLDLQDLAEGSPLLADHVVMKMAGQVSILARGVCPIADLGGGFEAYLMRLSANSRQQARRLLREAEKCGARFEIAGEACIDEFFDDLVRLHQQRWVAVGKPGCFAAPRFTEFHRALAREWLPAGHAVLARLSLAGEAVAVLFGFTTGSKFDFYQSGVRAGESGPLRSPGNLAHLLLMRELCGRGVARYDFLRGASSYKQRLATVETRLHAIQVWRRTLRSALFKSSRSIGRGIPKALRRIRPAHRSPAIQGERE